MRQPPQAPPLLGTMLIKHWLHLRIGSYHLFPAGVLPNIFQMVEPRLENVFVSLHTKLFEPITSSAPLGRSDPCWPSNVIVGKRLMGRLVSLRALSNIYIWTRSPKTASPQPRVELLEHELDSWVVSCCTPRCPWKRGRCPQIRSQRNDLRSSRAV